MCEITTTEKNVNGKTATGKWATEIVQRENSATKIEMVGKNGNTKLLSEITKTEKTTAA